jgi:outer membrane protein
MENKMKNIKLYYLLLPVMVCFLLPAKYVKAQKWFSSATYQVSVPMGDTKEYTDNISWRGFGLDFRYSLDKSSSVGFVLGWNVFHERTTQSADVELENPGTITGTQDRYLNSFPIMMNYHYYFGKRGGVRTFVGLSAGGYIMLQRFGIGVTSFQNDRWEWGVAPELGIAIPYDFDGGFLISGKYNYAFTGESVFGSDINHSYLTINVGFYWRP